MSDLTEVALVDYLKRKISDYDNTIQTQQLDSYHVYRRGMYAAYKEILSMLDPNVGDSPVKFEKSTSEQLVEQFDSSDAQDITIMGDIVHGLDFEYKKLEEEIRLLSQGIRNTYEVGQEILAEQQEVLNKISEAIHEGRSIHYIYDIINKKGEIVSEFEERD